MTRSALALCLVSLLTASALELALGEAGAEGGETEGREGGVVSRWRRHTGLLRLPSILFGPIDPFQLRKLLARLRKKSEDSRQLLRLLHLGDGPAGQPCSPLRPFAEKMKSLDAICAKLSRATEDSAAGGVKREASEGPEPSPPPATTASASRRKSSKPSRQGGGGAGPGPLVLKAEVKEEEEDDRGSLTELDLSAPSPIPGGALDGGSWSAGLPTAEEAVSKADACVEHFIRRFPFACGRPGCTAEPGKEHFHCEGCGGRLLGRREETLRHYKWHRKRAESLAHGFARFAAQDPCGPHFGSACPHALRQTHYHCLHQGCGKVYVSTSDVAVHGNSHRKAAQIAREGFRRFRASEDCAVPHCAFADGPHRTTHFHCLRPNCHHSFKNKADMDKHKAHHLRDEALARDGFKKWLKSEPCAFLRCPFSRLLNHIHCIRPGCDFVLHSTSQMYSHKRKHERAEAKAPSAGQSGGLGQTAAAPQSLLTPAAVAAQLSAALSASAAASVGGDAAPKLRIKQYDPDSQQFYSAGNSPLGSPGRSGPPTQAPGPPPGERLKIKHYDPITQGFTDGSPSPPPAVKKAQAGPTQPEGIDLGIFQQPFNLPIAPLDAEPEPEAAAAAKAPPPPAKLSKKDEKRESKWATDTWRLYLTRYTANDPCFPRCDLMYKDHYHCTAAEGGCSLTFRSKESVREHARQHQLLDAAAAHFTERCEGGAACRGAARRHWHCAACQECVLPEDGVFRRLEHRKLHEYAAQEEAGRGKKSAKLADPKKGRPKTLSSPRAAQPGQAQPPTGFQLIPDLKALIPGGMKLEGSKGGSSSVLEGFTLFAAAEACPDTRCKYSGTAHQHCSAPRCYFAASSAAALESHSQDFHASLEIPEGFACFDRDVVCAFDGVCPHSSKARHFHCLRPACPQAFLKVNALSDHQASHPPVSSSATALQESLAKAAGSFFPSATPAALAALLSSGGVDLVQLAQLGAQPQPPPPTQQPPYTVEQNCGRPFCKLKRNVHYHCGECSQGFSSPARLLPHLQKHEAKGQASSSSAQLGAALLGSLGGTGGGPPASLAASMDSLAASLAAAAQAKAATLHQAFHQANTPPTTSQAQTPPCKAADPAPTPPKKGSSKRKASSSAAAAPSEGPGGSKKFKFVDCTQDTIKVVEEANRVEDVAPEGFARFGVRSDCGVGGCVLNGLLHYHCLRPACRGLAIPDKAMAPAHISTH